MSKEKLRTQRWASISRTKLIAAVNKEIEKAGPSVVTEGFRNPKSVWGRVVKKLLKANTALDRFWCRSLYLKSKDPNVTAPDETMVYCYCKKPYEQEDDPTMIGCDTCDAWYHAICVGASKKDYQGAHYQCPRCASGTSYGKLLTSSDPESDVDEQGVPDLGTRISSPELPSATDSSGDDKPMSSKSSSEESGRQYRGYSKNREESEKDQSEFPSQNTQGRDEPVGADKGETKSQKRQLSPSTSSSDSVEKEKESMDDSKHREGDKKNPSQFPQQDTRSEDDSLGEDKEKVESKECQLSTSSTSSDPSEDEKQRLASKHELLSEMLISSNEWERIKPETFNPKASRGYHWRLKPREWSDVFAEAFTKFEQSCVIAFRTHRVLNTKEVYLTATAACSRKLCNRKYYFRIDEEPKGNHDVQVRIRATGKKMHEKMETAARQLKSSKRAHLREILKTTRPFKLFQKNYAATRQEEAIRTGNLTSVQSIGKYQKIREEAIRSLNLHQDFFSDLILLQTEFANNKKLRGKTLEGYIQGLNYKPFGLMLCTEFQLRILHRALKYFPNLCLCIDATGKCQRKLGAEHNFAKLLHYSVVIQLDVSDAPCIPICEFILSKQDNATIGTFLRMFAYYYRMENSVQRLMLGIRRVETDFSMALIISVLNSFDMGSLETYLDNAWRLLRGEQEAPETGLVLNVCRFHAIRAIKAKISQSYSRKDQRHVLMNWMYGFLYGRDLHSFCRRVADAVILCGSKKHTAEVMRLAKDVRRQTEKPDNATPWDVVDTKAIRKNDTMKTRSPFGAFAHVLCANRGIKLEGSDVTTSESDSDEAYKPENDPNPYRSRKFLSYLLETVFPYAPLLNQSLLYANNMSTLTDLTTAVAESWFNILKNHMHQHNLPMRCGRFAREHLESLEGRLHIFNDELERQIVLEKEKRRRMRKVPNSKAGESKKDAGRAPQVAKKSTAKPPPPRARSPPRSFTSSRKEEFYSGRAPQDAKKSTSKPPPPGPSSASGASTSKHSPFRPPFTSESSGHMPRDANVKTAKEEWHKKGKPPKASVEFSQLNSLYRLRWGSNIVLDGKAMPLSNSCSLDNVITVLYAMVKMYNECLEYVKTFSESGHRNSRKLLRIFNAMEKSDGVVAKTIFVTEIRREDSSSFSNYSKGSVSLEQNYAEEYNVQFFKELFVFGRERVCENPDCIVEKSDIDNIMDMVFRNPTQFSIKLHLENKVFCDAGDCKGFYAKTNFKFMHGPMPFLVYVCTSVRDRVARATDLLMEQMILGIKYKLFACTVHYGGDSGHFYAVFFGGNQLVKYDVLSSSLKVIKEIPGAHRINLVFLVRS